MYSLQLISLYCIIHRYIVNVVINKFQRHFFFKSGNSIFIRRLSDTHIKAIKGHKQKKIKMTKDDQKLNYILY